MQKIDLQVQTTASDGRHTPREVTKMAQEHGVRVIAITDHDTVGGVPEALLAGGEYGVRVIPGVEMSVEDQDSHILGLGIDYKNEKLLAELEKFKNDRAENLKKTMVALRENEGFVIEWEDVLRETKDSATALTSPHVVYAIMARPENKEKLDRDQVTSKQDFYKRYLKSTGPNLTSRKHISAADAIELLHQAGGLAIWSHPALHFQEKYDDLENFLKELISGGIDGLEVFSATHTEDDVEFLEGLSQKYHLLVTAGSDFHEAGKHVPNEHGLHSADTVGDFQTYGFSIDDIIPKLDEALRKR
jgi:hypothetical protein